jgi:hypothetical protein
MPDELVMLGLLVTSDLVSDLLLSHGHQMLPVTDFLGEMIIQQLKLLG